MIKEFCEKINGWSPCNDCNSCPVGEIIKEHDAKVRADAIEEIIAKIDDEYYDGGYGDYHEVAMIVRMLEQLKEQVK